MGTEAGSTGVSSTHGPFGTQSQSHSFQTFGRYSAFLRSAVADEESLQVGESLQTLAVQIEALIGMLQQPGAPRERFSTALVNLVGDLRNHRSLLLSLGGDWHRFYEFDAHFATLNHFRILVTQWAMQASPAHNSLPSPSEFDLAAWRVLGAGSLLLDVYEQSRQTAAVDQSDEPASDGSVLGRWRAWWSRRHNRRQSVRPQGSRGRRKGD